MAKSQRRASKKAQKLNKLKDKDEEILVLNEESIRSL